MESTPLATRIFVSSLLAARPTPEVVEASNTDNPITARRLGFAAAALFAAGCGGEAIPDCPQPLLYRVCTVQRGTCERVRIDGEFTADGQLAVTAGATSLGALRNDAILQTYLGPYTGEGLSDSSHPRSVHFQTEIGCEPECDAERPVEKAVIVTGSSRCEPSTVSVFDKRLEVEPGEGIPYGDPLPLSACDDQERRYPPPPGQPLSPVCE